MMRRLLLSLLLLSFASVLFADDQRVSPIPYAWVATACDTWACAMNELSLANGDPMVIVLPTSSAKFPWAIIRRVIAGSLYFPEEPPFNVECYDKMATASTRFDAIPSERSPLLVTAHDGTMLVICLKNAPDASTPRTRSVRH